MYPALPTNRSTDSTTAQHVDDHNELHRFHNMVKGPFHLAYNTPGIDTGVMLWTPELAGETIIGVWGVFSQMFDVSGEHIGLGISGTLDADLAFQLAVTGSLPAAVPTFPRSRGTAINFTETAGLLTTAPIIARTLNGGNTVGALDLYVITLPGSP